MTTRPRDLPVAGRRCELLWRKRRWICSTAVCPRRTFTEQVPQVPARARLTQRLRQAASGRAVADGGGICGAPGALRGARRVRETVRGNPRSAANP
ncbi:transposase family protein [Nonomuraea zeae]|uniref:transposase family protein n=1 Tax=Nonomuraea zeae TaxID=1642303 RepID=UPI0014785148